MAMISVLDVKVKNNLGKFTDPFIFDITFESLTNLKNDIEWKVIYIGSQGNKARAISEEDCSCSAMNSNNAKADNADYELDCISLGPITKGTLTFQFQVEAADYKLLPVDSILGIQAVVITASYNSNEFIRIGYYVNNQYMDKDLIQNPPAIPLIDKILRYVISDAPRVTRFPIRWDDNYEEDTPLLDEESVSVEREDGLNENVNSEEERNLIEEDEGKVNRQIQNLHSYNSISELEIAEFQNSAKKEESEDFMNLSTVAEDNEVNMI